MQYFISATLLIVAAIHLLPVVGAFGAGRLAVLYGITVSDPSLEVLLRHRAVLFGLLGGFLAYAAFRPTYQPLAFVAGAVSVASFLLLAFAIGGLNSLLSRVVVADILAAILLVAGAGSYVWSQTRAG